MKTIEEQRAACRAYYRNNREVRIAKTKAYYHKNREAIRLRRKEIWKSRSLYNKEYSLKKKFGISLVEYYDMIKNQKGVCAICENVSLTKPLAVDHNHKTGRIRGLLCPKCNLALGTVESVDNWLSKVEKYLMRYN